MHQTHLRGGQQQRKRSPVGGLIAAAGRMLVGNQSGGQVPGSSTYAMAGAPGEEEDTPRDDDEGVEIKRTVSTADDHVEGYASGGASNDVVRVGPVEGDDTDEESGYGAAEHSAQPPTLADAPPHFSRSRLEVKQQQHHTTTTTTSFARRSAAFTNPTRRTAAVASSLRASANAVGAPLMHRSIDERTFQREVIDVHTEIDKLLGSLKGELEHWRADFEALQGFWMSRVVVRSATQSANENDGTGEPAAADALHDVDMSWLEFRTLDEFRGVLERYLDERDGYAQQLEAWLKGAEEERGEFGAQLDALSSELDQHRASRSALEEELAALNDQFAEVNEKCHRLVSEVQNHETAARDVHALHAEAESTLGETRARLARLEEEHATVVDELCSVRTQHVEVQEMYAMRQREFTEKAKESHVQASELARVSRALADAKLELEGVVEARRLAEASLAERDAAAATLVAEQKEARRNAAALEAKLAAETAAHADVAASLAAARADLAQLTSRADAANVAIQRLESDKADLEATRAALDARVNELSERAAANRDEANGLKEENLGLKTSVTALETKLLALRKELEASAYEKEEYRLSAQSAKGALDEFTASMESRIAAIRTEKEAAEARNLNMLRERERIAVESAEEWEAKLRRAAAAAEEAAEQREAEHQAALAREREEHSHALDDAHRRTAEVQRRAAEARAAADAVAAAAKDEALETLRNELAAEAGSQLADAKSAHEAALHEQHQSHLAAVQALQEEKARAVSEERLQRTRLEERLREEFSSTVTRQADTFQSEAKEREASFLAERKRLQDELVAAQAKAQADARTQADAIRKLQDESVSLKKQLASSADTTAQLETALATAQRDAAAAAQSAEGTCQSLRDQVEQLQAALVKAKAEVKAARKAARQAAAMQRSQLESLLQEHSSTVFQRMQEVLGEDGDESD